MTLPAPAESQPALRASSREAGFHHNLGVKLWAAGAPRSALHHFERAARQEPANLDFLFALCRCREAIGDFRRALPGFQTIARQLPHVAKAHYHLAECLLHTSNFSRAIESFERCLSLDPKNRVAAHNAAYCYVRLGGHQRAMHYYRLALRDPDYVMAHSSLLHTLHYTPGIPPADIFREHRQWARRHAAKLAVARAFKRDTPYGRGGGVLRIGYVSADFRMHPVSFFIEPILKHHRRSRFAVHCYSNVEDPDSVTRRIRSQADSWVDVSRLSDKDASDRILEDRIDILVDLSGHTAGNRLLVFARKPAPVQVTYLGYSGTTGLDRIDYRITDRWADPIGESDAFYTEKLVRLPTGFSCYGPSARSPRVLSLPAVRNGHITFGSLNNRAKINHRVIECWRAILDRVPNSKLLLKNFSTASKDDREHLIQEFGRNGIRRNRLIIRKPLLSHAEHLRLYNEIDIALDTFPYNGHTTTCEALWMGVPVVTLAGCTPVARVGVSLLSRIGLAGFVAESEPDYVNLAAETASNLEVLRGLRRDLRRRMSSSTLTDAPRFTRALEKAYEQMLYSQYAGAALGTAKSRCRI